MNSKKYFFLVVVCFLFFNCRATWSVIIIDPITRQVGIAAASCSYNVYGIGGIVPGKGAIVAQAMSNMRAKQKGMEMLGDGVDPEKILVMIIDPSFDPMYTQQQYGIISVDHPNKAVTFTGGGTHPSKGSLTGHGISVQGNTLSDYNVIKAVYDTVISARQRNLSLHEVLMLALEAGSHAGGDNRCGAQTATSAFITVMNSTDNPNKPYLNLVISGINRGRINAVSILRKRYEVWKRKQ